MSLSLVKSKFKRIGFRLSLTILVLLLANSCLIFGLSYLFLRTSLEAKDREIIDSKLRQYAWVYRLEGPSGLYKILERAETRVAGEDLIVRIVDGDQVVFRSEPPVLKKFDWPQVEAGLKLARTTSGLVKVDARTANQALEIASRKLFDGRSLEVARDNDDREDVLERSRRAFFWATLPMILLGALASFLFARKTLAPVRGLIAVMKEVQEGKTEARVDRTGNGDELDMLSGIFNQMIARVESLILRMRESLDNVAHDLRTPMTRMRGLAEQALQSESLSDAKEALSETVESSEQILTVLNTVMDISEIESGTLKLNPVSLDISEVLHQCMDLYSIVAEEQGISLSMESQSIIFQADARIRQAIANLVDNALKFSPSGTAVLLSAEREENRLAIRVRDQGFGIANEDLARIWDRLYRADRSRSTRGSGLGLSLVKSIVQAHGGSVGVKSQVAVGTTFEIVLPL
jgi:signal transduction histidine kinase